MTQVKKPEKALQGATIIRLNIYQPLLIVEKDGKLYQITDAIENDDEDACFDVEEITSICSQCEAISKCDAPVHQNVAGCFKKIKKIRETKNV